MALSAAALDHHPRWPFGPMTEERRARIGSDYGFSGQIERLWLRTDTGAVHTIVVKCNDAWETESTVLWHVRGPLGSQVPDCLGAHPESDRGCVVLEDLGGLEQGDYRAGTDPGRAQQIARLLAKVHQIPPPAGIPTRAPQTWREQRWRDRVNRAAQRYPTMVIDAGDLLALHARMNLAAKVLGAEPRGFVHGDAHLDNVLWRDDGSPVLLDWEAAASGPLADDLASLLLQAPYAHTWERAVLDGYRAAGSAVPPSLWAALLVAVRGAVGWAGLPESELHPNAAASRRKGLVIARSWLGRIFELSPFA